jgi:hypothetical protein
VTAGEVELLTVTPAGKSSVNEKFVKSVSLGAKKSSLNRELPPGAIVEGENDFVPVISVPRMVTLALAGRRSPTPCAVVNWLRGIVFVTRPEGVPAGIATGTEIVQVPGAVGLPAGMVPPVSRTTLSGAGGGAIVPPQLFVIVPDTVNGAGKLSVKFTPVYGEPVGFCRVIISVVVPPAEKVEGENCFVTPIS